MTRVRRATSDDARAIAAIEAVAAHQPWSLEAVEAHLGLPHRQAWVAESEHVMGHLLCQSVADTAEVLTVAVHPDARRRGIARGLMGVARETWSRQGVVTAWLEVRADNLGAQHLYRSTRWRQTGRRRSYYADGCDALVFELEVA